eukprot:scaffold980_cov248-Pinguiococcus_pyrenoidosus.AAC.6
MTSTPLTSSGRISGSKLPRTRSAVRAIAGKCTRLLSTRSFTQSSVAKAALARGFSESVNTSDRRSEHTMKARSVAGASSSFAESGFSSMTGASRKEAMDLERAVLDRRNRRRGPHPTCAVRLDASEAAKSVPLSLAFASSPSLSPGFRSGAVASS